MHLSIREKTSFSLLETREASLLWRDGKLPLWREDNQPGSSDPGVSDPGMPDLRLQALLLHTKKNLSQKPKKPKKPKKNTKVL